MIELMENTILKVLVLLNSQSLLGYEKLGWERFGFREKA
jgi:hypothetical protein